MKPMSITIKGRYTKQRIELDLPLAIKDGDEVELQLVSVHSVNEERDAISSLGMERLEEVWDNPQDAVYDDWKRLYADRMP